jgi:hypothetical protein
MTRVINDPRVEIVPVVSAIGGTRPPAELERLQKLAPSTQDSELYRALVRQSNAVYPEAAVTPYSERGIAAERDGVDLQNAAGRRGKEVKA